MRKINHDECNIYKLSVQQSQQWILFHDLVFYRTCLGSFVNVFSWCAAFLGTCRFTNILQWLEWHWLIEISCVCRFRIISNHMSSCSWWVLFTCINMSCEVSSTCSMFFQQVLPITAWSRLDPIAPQGDLFGDQVRCGMISFFRCNRTLRHISTPCRSFVVQKGSQNFRRWRFLLKDVWRGWEPLPSANILHPNAYWKPRLRFYSLLKGGWGGLHSHKDTWQG